MQIYSNYVHWRENSNAECHCAMCKDSKKTHFVLYSLSNPFHPSIMIKESTEKHEDRHSCSHKTSTVANPFSILVMAMMGLQDLTRREYLCYLIQKCVRCEVYCSLSLLRSTISTIYLSWSFSGV